MHKINLYAVTSLSLSPGSVIASKDEVSLQYLHIVFT